MTQQQRRLAALLAVTSLACLVAFVNGETPAHSWIGTHNCVKGDRETFEYRSAAGKESYAATVPDWCCQTCAERCYTALFNATVQNAASLDESIEVCNENGDDCTVKLFLRTAPCRRCETASEYEDVTEITDDSELKIHTATSKCEIKQYYAFVGAEDPEDAVSVGLLFDDECETPLNGTSSFFMYAIEDDFMQVQITDCIDDDDEWVIGMGRELDLVHNAYSGKSAFPDPCFAGKHHRDELETVNEGTLESMWFAYTPVDGDDIWLEHVFTDTLVPVDCARYETELAEFEAVTGFTTLAEWETEDTADGGDISVNAEGSVSSRSVATGSAAAKRHNKSKKLLRNNKKANKVAKKATAATAAAPQAVDAAVAPQQTAFAAKSDAVVAESP